jgi:coenzyme F420-reducing hydrogenase gamma subunit
MSEKQLIEVGKKLRVGFYGITGCAGCLESVIFNEDEIVGLFNLVDVQAFPFIKGANSNVNLDVAFMEGLVASPRDQEMLQEVRKNARVLVALGACANSGCIPAYRHYTPLENYEHLVKEKEDDIKDVLPSPIDAHVTVDFAIPGCPPNGKEILEVVKAVVAGKAPRSYAAPVCIECRRKGNYCLLELGKPCLGAITRGGCGAVCPSGGFECWGCRGQTEDANLPALIELLEQKGFSWDFIKQRIRTFVGLKTPDLEPLRRELEVEKV